MNKLLSFIVALGCTLAGAQAVGRITYVRLGPSHMIFTTDNNYAILSPTMLQHRWTIVVRNGDSFSLYSARFARINKRANELTADEWALIEDTKARLLQVRETRAEGAADVTLAEFFGSTSVVLPLNARSGRPLYHSSPISIDQISQDNFSIFMRALPAGIVRVFVVGEVVTFVHDDSRLLMQPSSALTSKEQAFFAQLMQNTEEAKEHFDTYSLQLDDIRRQLQELSGFSDLVESLREDLATSYLRLQRQCEAQMVFLNAEFQENMSGLL